MLFWFKKKTTVLDCFTFEIAAYDRFKVDKAAKFLPDWYKNLPNGDVVTPYQMPISNMKKCSGFIEYFKNSIALPSWDYVYFKTGNEIVETSLSNQFITNHSSEQYGSFLDSSYKHFKITPPWLIHSNNKTKFLQTFSPWCYAPRHNVEKIMHLPGVVDFYYQNSVNINLFIRTAGTGNSASIVTFEPGVPLVFYTPLEDNKIKIKHHLISVGEFEQRTRFLTMTPGWNRLKINKQFIDKRDEESKCPFGFGKK